MQLDEVLIFANSIRKKVVEAISSKGGGHIGGSLSICDLLAVLYGDVMKYDPVNPNWNDRDYLICSKGHAGPAIYATLALKGFFPREWLKDLNKGGTHLPGHCDRNKVPGIDATTGSLGQGLSIACGLAHSIKLAKTEQYVYCITGDGENDEGQIWEAAMYASHHKLNHLIMFLDWNKKQIDGTNDEVMGLCDLAEKYRAFGWHVQTINGNDIDSIRGAIAVAKGKKTEQPSMILLDTVKGAGIKAIESLESNHCIGISESLAQSCYEELDKCRKELSAGGAY